MLGVVWITRSVRSSGLVLVARFVYPIPSPDRWQARPIQGLRRTRTPSRPRPQRAGCRCHPPHLARRCPGCSRCPCGAAVQLVCCSAGAPLTSSPRRRAPVSVLQCSAGAPHLQSAAPYPGSGPPMLTASGSGNDCDSAKSKDGGSLRLVPMPAADPAAPQAPAPAPALALARRRSVGSAPFGRTYPSACLHQLSS